MPCPRIISSSWYSQDMSAMVTHRALGPSMRWKILVPSEAKRRPSALDNGKSARPRGTQFRCRAPGKRAAPDRIVRGGVDSQHPNREAGRTAIRRMPDWDRYDGLNTRLGAPVPGRIDCQSLPSAVTPPMPVTTTRRVTTCLRSQRSPGA
jgi:hypothetical protein